VGWYFWNSLWRFNAILFSRYGAVNCLGSYTSYFCRHLFGKDSSCCVHENSKLPTFVHLTEERTLAVNEAQETVLSLSAQLFGERSIEIELVQHYNERLHLRLRRRTGLNLEVGSEIKVIDLTEGSIMGTFEVVQVLSTHYIARNSSNVNALWLGYVLDKGGVESSPPPNVMALFIPRG
jgi:hypothetical protein